MITKNKLSTIAAEIEVAIQAIGEKHGVKLRSGNATYSETNFSLKVEGAILLDDGTAFTKEMKNFKNYASFLGLKETDLGKEFSMQGQTFVICGMRSLRAKRPILAKEKKSGNTFQFSSTVVAKLIAA